MIWKMVIMFTVAIIYTTSLDHPIRVMRTWNGCPYRFDMGFRGAVYPIPKVCSSILAELKRKDFKPGNTPFTIKLYYTKQRDKFRVKLESPRNISMSEMRMTAFAVLPNGTVDTHYSIGFFHQKVYHEYYCCDRSKLKAVVRRVYSRRSGYFTHIHLNWSNLNYTGRAVFRAELFVGRKAKRERLPNVQSKGYIFPPVLPDFQKVDTRGLLENWTIIEKDEYDYEDDILEPEGKSSTTTETTTETYLSNYII